MIIFVDDEPFNARFYLDELRNVFGGQNILFRDTLDDAQAELQKHANDVQGVILDIMMPPKKGWDPMEVEDGLLSGIRFLEDNADLLQVHKIAVLILTNRDVNKIVSAVEGLKARLHSISVNQKTQTPAWILPNLVQRQLAPK